jgi:hypothetical protein
MLDWERNWRGAGVGFAVLVIIASVIYGSQPKVGASTDELVSFFDGDRTRILVATVFFCFSFLELLWFGAALSSVLRDAGKGGWGAAATASSAAVAAVLFLRMAVRASLAFSIAGSGRPEITSGLADLGFVLTVILSFPAAMFVMSGAFGLRQAGIISNRFFSAGVAAVVLVLLGGTTWANDGFWAPDGGFAIISQIILFAWIAGLSGFLVMRSPSTARVSEQAVLPTP